jgi:hypothetical protein
MVKASVGPCRVMSHLNARSEFRTHLAAGVGNLASNYGVIAAAGQTEAQSEAARPRSRPTIADRLSR